MDIFFIVLTGGLFGLSLGLLILVERLGEVQ